MFGEKKRVTTRKLIHHCVAGVLLLIGLGLLFTAAAPPSSYAWDDAPAWLRQAAAVNIPTQDKRIPALVLLREKDIRVSDDGKITTVKRGAVRILSKEGRDEAVTVLHYMTDTGKVRDMRAWLIRPSGEVMKYGKDEVSDQIAAPNDVFAESRVKVINARNDAEPGAIFGYEWTSEDKSVFTQFDWQFQGALPTLQSRFSITLPEGWRAEGVTFNHPKIEPTVAGSSYTWELRDLPYVEDEPASPPVTNLVPRLAVSYFPAPGSKSLMGRTFESWVDVSRWLTELSDGQANLDDALAGKARELTAGAKTEFDRIRAIARYVQSVNYVSIQTGVGRGGGYRPHAAVDVFAKSYGDCKDKANLMRAMLKAVNIPSYLVSIYADDPTFVREEWPSPQQFDHCIIAMKVSDETTAPTIVKHPTLGRLLIFDPTDDNTPVGDLPFDEQGSLALIVAGDQGALLRMPETPADMNSLERQTDVVLMPGGAITATVRERASGKSAVDFRREFRALSQSDYVKRIERWVTGGATGAAVTKVEPEDKFAEGRFALEIEFNAPRYGQLMQGRLLLFNPTIVSRREALFLTDSTRKYPVLLNPYAFVETVKVTLPNGFVVDETPDACNLIASFGKYKTEYETVDGKLTYKRSLVLNGGTIPVAQYAKARAFFEQIRAAEQAPVVLTQK